MKTIEYKFTFSRQYGKERRYEYLKFCGEHGGYNALLLLLPIEPLPAPHWITKRITGWNIVHNLFRLLEGEKSIQLVLYKNRRGKCTAKDILEYLQVYSYVPNKTFLAYFTPPLDLRAGITKDDIDKIAYRLFPSKYCQFLQTEIRGTYISVYTLNMSALELMSRYMGRFTLNYSDEENFYWRNNLKKQLNEFLR